MTPFVKDCKINLYMVQVVEKKEVIVVQVNNKLKGKLVEYKKTYEECAKAINVSKTTFSKKINGQTDFTAIEVKKLIDFLELESREAIEIFLS